MRESAALTSLLAGLAAVLGVEPSYLVDRKEPPPLDAELLGGCATKHHMAHRRTMAGNGSEGRLCASRRIAREAAWSSRRAYSG